MLSAHTLFHCGAGSLLLLGIGHTLTEVAMSRRPVPPELKDAMSKMEQTLVSMPGRQVRLIDLMRGFSLMMGILLIAVGALDYAIARAGAITETVLAINVALCGLGLALSVRFFFPVPVVLCALSLCCFSAAWFV